MVGTRRQGSERGGKGKGGPIHGDERRFDLEWWAHNELTDNVSHKCTFKTHLISAPAGVAQWIRLRPEN